MARRRYRLPGTSLPRSAGPEGECRSARRAAIRAGAIAGADAIRVVLTGDDRHADRILASLGMDPPPEARLRFAARPGLMVADATGADERSLRRLARVLPRRRPVDGIGYVAGLDGDAGENGAEQAGRLAKLLQVHAALHIVIPGESETPIFEPCPELAAPDVHALVRGLRERLVHGWLNGAVRPDFGSRSGGPDERMDARVEAAIGRSRSASLRLSSLAWGGPGLVAAVASTWDRTVPAERQARGRWAGAAALSAGIVLGTLGAITQAERAEEVDQALSVLAPALKNAGSDPDAFAGGTRALRYARAAAALERAARPSVVSPLSGLHPGSAALRTLASRTVVDAIVRPASRALRERTQRDLRPRADPDEWLDRAGVALARIRGPGPYDAAALLAAAYDTPEGRWRRYLARRSHPLPAAGADLSLRAPPLRAPACDPSPWRRGALAARVGETCGLAGVGVSPDAGAAPRSEAAENGFVRTMETWARDRYAKSTVFEPARRAASTHAWREEMAALRSMDDALGSGAVRWLAPGGSDPELERILARARGILDAEAVDKGRAAARRAGQAAAAALARLRLRGAYPLVDLHGEEGPALAPAARGLLHAYETLAQEELLAHLSPQPSSRGREDAAGSLVRGTPARGVAARQLVASLKRLDRRIAEIGISRDLRERLGAEIESAALEEAASRIEAAAAGPGGAQERAAIRELERLARAKGAHHAARRLGAVHARLDEGRARAALRAIEEHDPLGIEFDASTDRLAVLDRVVAAIARLDALHRAEPELRDFAWEQLGRALRGYRIGDRASVLTRMAERARVYADRGTATCNEPARPDTRPPGGYAGRAWAAFERRLEAVCRKAGAGADADAERRLRSFYEEHLAWRWPYASAPEAPAAPRSTLIELLQRAKGRETGDLSPGLAAIIEPWSRNRHGDPVLELAVEWRTEPEGERNAEHLVSYRIEGMRDREDGGREWRYGDRLYARLRLAKDSPLRFADGGMEASIPIGKKDGVRRLATGDLAATLTIEAPVTDAPAAGARQEERTLRISATLRAIGKPDRKRPPSATARPIRASPDLRASLR